MTKRDHSDPEAQEKEELEDQDLDAVAGEDTDTTVEAEPVDGDIAEMAVDGLDGEALAALEDVDVELLDQDGEPRRRTKITKKEVLERLLEKTDQIMKISKQAKAHEARAREANDQVLRIAAEFDNYRKRTRKEWELLKQQTKGEVILEILTVVDDFERAFQVVEDGKSDEFVQGIRLIHNNLRSVLEKIGVGEIEALEKPFNPTYHMAVGQIDTDETESGLVAEVVQKGYCLDGNVIRPANVIVAK